MKHTHRGHCQACGRLQAVVPRSGLIALHGYNVEHGYFNGTCQGSKQKPLEVSRAFLDAFADGCDRAAASHDTSAAELTSGARDPLRCSYGMKWEPSARNGRGAHVEQWQSWADSDGRHRDGQRRRDIAEHEQHARHLRDHAKRLRELAERVHGQPLQPAEPEKPEIVAGDIVRANGELHIVKQIISRGMNGRTKYVVTNGGRTILRARCTYEGKAEYTEGTK